MEFFLFYGWRLHVGGDVTTNADVVLSLSGRDGDTDFDVPAVSGSGSRRYSSHRSNIERYLLKSTSHC